MKRAFHTAAWLTATLVLAPAAAAEHPFMLWTREEAAAIRRKVETQEWAKAAYERLRNASRRDGRDPQEASFDAFNGLFRCVVMGDRAAGEEEKKQLLAPNARGGDHMTPFRYDAVYDLLTPAERQQVEQQLRSSVQRCTEGTREIRWTRSNWLPNLAYPWIIAAHIAAVSLRDEKLLEEVWRSNVGLKWYFDDYLCDSGFYNEEFGKMYNTPRHLLLFGWAAERLGRNDLGFGYVGKSGQTLRGHIEALIRIGFPKWDLGTSRPRYPWLTIGDTRGVLFQQALVNGYFTDGSGGNHAGTGEPLWHEIGYRKWPDAGFGYFLAQMRRPDQDKYYPSLIFGLDPVDPAAVKPPAAPSGVYPQRGLVMLRAEESPAYWEGPWPAVGLRLATPYCHDVKDSFALCGFSAFNRMLYLNKAASSNYNGVDPGWSNSQRGHCNVMVDLQEPRQIGEVPVRHEFTALAKFSAARGKDIFPEVDQTRALLLTREYLFEVFALQSPRPRLYQWLIQTYGNMCPDRPSRWAASRDLVGTLYDVSEEWSTSGDADWAVTAVQSTCTRHPQLGGEGESWFKDRIGVRVAMLGEPGTNAYTGWTPVTMESSGQWFGRNRLNFGNDERGGALIAAVRKTDRTAFVALHEPFKTRTQVAEFRRIAQTPQGVAAAVSGVAGSPVNDRVMLRLGDGYDQPLTLAGAGESFTFSDYAYVRIGRERVEAVGGLKAMKLHVGPAPMKFVLNGQPHVTATAGEFLTFGAVPAVEAAAFPAPAAPLAGPIAARWRPGWALCLPAGGPGTMTLKLRNNGLAPVNATLRLRCSPGLKALPATVELRDFGAGEEKDVTVQASAEPATLNTLMRMDLASDGGVEVQSPGLPVAHGVTAERGIFWPHDFWVTVYSPRYLVKYYYMESDGALLLLDPLGARRFGTGGQTYPSVRVLAADEKTGGKRDESGRLPKFAYFIPVIVKAADGSGSILYEGGKHAHGATAPVEYWFTEDWIIVHHKSATAPVIFDWQPQSFRSEESTDPGMLASLAAQKMPPKMLVATPDGKVAPGEGGAWPKNLREVAGVFHRPAGFVYGSACFYPKGASVSGNSVEQPGDQPMAFTYCTEEEFPALLAKWLKNPPSGQPTPEQLSIYRAAWMPK